MAKKKSDTPEKSELLRNFAKRRLKIRDKNDFEAMGMPESIVKNDVNSDRNIHRNPLLDHKNPHNDVILDKKSTITNHAVPPVLRKLEKLHTCSPSTKPED